MPGYKVIEIPEGCVTAKKTEAFIFAVTEVCEVVMSNNEKYKAGDLIQCSLTQALADSTFLVRPENIYAKYEKI